MIYYAGGAAIVLGLLSVINRIDSGVKFHFVSSKRSIMFDGRFFFTHYGTLILAPLSLLSIILLLHHVLIAYAVDGGICCSRSNDDDTLTKDTQIGILTQHPTARHAILLLVDTMNIYPKDISTI